MSDFTPIYKCRRSIIALVAITCLTAIALINKQDTSSAIATVVMAIAAANAGQTIFIPKRKTIISNDDNNITSLTNNKIKQKASQNVDNPDA